MAQNISILEGGTAQQFGQVNKLKIANSGGGTSLWVPEDEVNTKSLHVDSNGTYYSSKDDCYGYDEVSVNIIDECFGYDDDGNLWDVEVDDDDFLEEEKLPVRIEITTPPDKTTYIVGEPINTAGMVVTAYYADGTEWGEVPREEYTIDPIVATTGGSAEEYSDGDGVVAKRVNIISAPSLWEGTAYVGDAILGSFYGKPCTIDARASQAGASVLLTKYNHPSYGIGIYGRVLDSPTGYVADNIATYHDGGYERVGGSVVSYDTTRFKCGSWEEYFTDLPTSTKNPENAGTMRPTGGSETITVSWSPYEAVEEMTATFEITVKDPTPVPPISGDDSGGGGSSGGSW